MMQELLYHCKNLVDIKMRDNDIRCGEYEPAGLSLLKLLSANNTITVRLLVPQFGMVSS